jgi:hypothetical protein
MGDVLSWLAETPWLTPVAFVAIFGAFYWFGKRHFFDDDWYETPGGWSMRRRRKGDRE